MGNCCSVGGCCVEGELGPSVHGKPTVQQDVAQKTELEAMPEQQEAASGMIKASTGSTDAPISSDDVHPTGLQHNAEPFKPDILHGLTVPDLSVYLASLHPVTVQLAALKELTARLSDPPAGAPDVSVPTRLALADGQQCPAAVNNLVRLASSHDPALQSEALNVIEHAAYGPFTKVLLGSDLAGNVLSILVKLMSDDSNKDQQYQAVMILYHLTYMDNEFWSDDAALPVLPGITAVLQSKSATNPAKYFATKSLNRIFAQSYEATVSPAVEPAVQPLVDMLVSNSSSDASVAGEALAVWIEGPSSSSTVYRNQCTIGAALANNKLHLLKPGPSSECWDAHLHLLAVLCKDHALNQSYLLHQDGFVDRLLAILRDGEDIGPSMQDLMECLASQWQDFDLALHVMHHPQGMAALMAGLDSKSEQCRLASSTILLAMAHADTFCLVGREEWAGQGGVSGQPGVLEKLLKCPGGPHKPHQILMMMLAAVDSQHKDKLLAHLAGEDAEMHKAAYLVARTAAWQYISQWHYEETDEYEGRYRNGSSGPATTAKDLYPAYPFDLARVNTKSGCDVACVLYAEASLASSWALEAIVGLLASQYPEERVGAGCVLLDGLNDHPSSHLLPVLLQPEVAKGLAQVLPESAELTERVRVLGWWLKQDGSSLDQASRQFIEQLMALPCMVEAKAAEERAYAE